MAKFKKPPAGGKHKVKEGEWVGSIAATYSYYDWFNRVWQREENKALRDKRQDPHVLTAGDQLFIPPLEEKEEPGSTEQKNRFRLKTAREALRIRLLGTDGQPLASEPYELRVEHGGAPDKFEQQNESTDDDGILEESIPLSATRAVLKLKNQGNEIELLIGHLEPLDLSKKKVLIKGVQQRLAALGFEPGRIDGMDGPLTQAAVKRFQQFCKDNAGSDASIIDSGPVDGIVGEKTVAALLKYYGC